MFCELIWHTLTIVICQWYVLSWGLTNCVFSCFLVDWLPVLAKRQAASQFSVNAKCSYYVELNCSHCCELQLFLLLRTSTVLIAVNSTVLITSDSSCSYLCRCILYPSRVYTTLSTLDSALLCNSEIPLHILILWWCLPNILKRVVWFSWYLVVYKFIHYIHNCKLSLK